MNENNINIDLRNGFASSPAGILTFEIQGLEQREEIRANEYANIYNRFITDNYALQLGEYNIPFWGEGHNLYPQEVFATIRENKLLPEVIEKQIKFLFGKGPRLYREIVKTDNPGADGDASAAARRIRIPVEDPEIQAWLDSWEERGYSHFWEYLRNLIMDFYHVKTCVTKYHFTRARRLQNAETAISPIALPIAALTYVASDEARLATTQKNLNRQIKNDHCRYVAIGDWLNPATENYEIFNRFNPAEPFRYPVAVAFNSDKTFSKPVYAYNNWFKGLFEWIKASNLSPRYLNSYLKNALNAHIHVIIPHTWYRAQEETLQTICNENLMAPGAMVQTEYRGVKLVNDKGAPVRYFKAMMEQLVVNELRALSNMMSGEGKNQGKLYATTKWGEDGWEFKEFPGKFKEYFDAIIQYDKRADQVILAGKGINSSITNVENDGVISKSGSDVYYNYLIYVASLTLDEYFITKEINRAIALNFPQKKEIKLGFWIDIPAKMQETTPSNRLQNTATPEPPKPQNNSDNP
jgi:hypothetical protein